jgi:hypothetical protein
MVGTTAALSDPVRTRLLLGHKPGRKRQSRQLKNRRFNPQQVLTETGNFLHQSKYTYVEFGGVDRFLYGRTSTLAEVSKSN